MDLINGIFELLGGLLLCLNVRAVWKTKSIAGVSTLPVILFTVWGFWNLAYYPHLHQPFSTFGAVTVVIANLAWLSLVNWFNLRIGTRSLLLGYHAFWLHPFFVAAAWWKLYGFPVDPRLWFAFFLHDIGYIGKPNMDGAEGIAHPFTGAHILHALFDGFGGSDWYHFSLYHSRTICNMYFGRPSDLCFADKLAFNLYPVRLLKLMYKITGEGDEYLHNGTTGEDHQTFETWYPQALEYNIQTLKKEGLLK